MRQRIKMYLVACLACLLLVPTGAYASGTVRSELNVNGKPVSTLMKLQNGRQMVPAAIFRTLNANVNWSERYRSAVVSKNNTIIGFPSGKSYADYDLYGRNQWKRDELSTTIINTGGTVYIPLAYTARKLGMTVKYNPRTKKTSISTAGRAGVHSPSAAIVTAAQGTATQEDLNWLYKITEAEAGGESFKGKVAVAASILNRVESPDWPDSIKETIFHVTHYNGKSYYQYSPVLDKRIYNVTPSEETKKAVHAALNGEDPSRGAVVFYNPAKTDNLWVRSREKTVTIGSHVFAK